MQVEVPVICFHQNIQDDDPYLTSTDHTGFIYVDNDNETVSENTPNLGLSVDDFRYNDEWGHDRIYFRRLRGEENWRSKLLHHDRKLKMTKLNYFSNSMGKRKYDTCNKWRFGWTHAIWGGFSNYLESGSIYAQYMDLIATTFGQKVR